MLYQLLALALSAVSCAVVAQPQIKQGDLVDRMHNGVMRKELVVSATTTPTKVQTGTVLKRPAIKDVLRGLFIPMGMNNGSMYGWMKVPECNDFVMVRLDGEYWHNPELTNCTNAEKAFKISYVQQDKKGAVTAAPAGKYYWRSDSALRVSKEAQTTVAQKRKLTGPNAMQAATVSKYPSAKIEKRFNGATRRLAELHKTAA